MERPYRSTTYVEEIGGWHSFVLEPVILDRRMTAAGKEGSAYVPFAPNSAWSRQNVALLDPRLNVAEVADRLGFLQPGLFCVGVQETCEVYAGIRQPTTSLGTVRGGSTLACRVHGCVVMKWHFDRLSWI